MKTKNFLITEEGQNFIDLSEQLRGCLESKLDELFQKSKFGLYFKRDVFSIVPDNDEELVVKITGIENDNKVFAHSAITAVKTWYSMYDDDRISVLEKFYSYSKELPYKINLPSMVELSIIFSKVFFMELAVLLNDIKWRPIRLYYRQAYKFIDGTRGIAFQYKV